MADVELTKKKKKKYIEILITLLPESGLQNTCQIFHSKIYSIIQSN